MINTLGIGLIPLMSAFQFSAFETRSLPALSRSYPRHFTFYVAHRIRSIQRFYMLGPSFGAIARSMPPD